MRGGLCVHGSDQAEVGDLDPAVIAYQHVLGLYVAVDQPGPVRGAERGEHGFQDVEGRAGLERAALAQHVAQGAARDVLHREVHIRAVRALVEHSDDVGVREARDGLRLADEALHEAGVRGEARVHHLEREHPVEPGVHGAVDRGHAADRDTALDAVALVERPPDERVLHGGVHDGRFYEVGVGHPAVRARTVSWPWHSGTLP